MVEQKPIEQVTADKTAETKAPIAEVAKKPVESGKSFHILKSGDDLEAISEKYNVSVEDLISLNKNIKDLKSGDKLLLK